MDYEALRAFLTLADSLHFGRASRQRNMSPSALSRTVRRLEDELGQHLFLRDKRRVELTASGMEFRTYALGVLDGWESMRRSMENRREAVSGELRLFSSVAASYTILAEMFQSLRKSYPGVHIRLQTGDSAQAIERVLRGEADVAVAARPGSLPRNIVFKAVKTTPLLFIAPVVASEAAMLTERRPVPWDRVPMILSETGLSRKRADTWFRTAGIRPTVYAEVSGHEAIVSMVRLGCGVGIVPELVLERFALPGEIRVVDVSPPLEPYVVGLCAHRLRLESPVVRALWGILPEASRNRASSPES